MWLEVSDEDVENRPCKVPSWPSMYLFKQSSSYDLSGSWQDVLWWSSWNMRMGCLWVCLPLTFSPLGGCPRTVFLCLLDSADVWVSEPCASQSITTEYKLLRRSPGGVLGSGVSRNWCCSHLYLSGCLFVFSSPIRHSGAWPFWAVGGKVKRSSFCALPGKRGPQWAPALRLCVPSWRGQWRVL